MQMGAKLIMNAPVTAVNTDGEKIRSVTLESGEELLCDYLISSMAIKDLINALPSLPGKVKEISDALPYRDFITVGLLLNRLELVNKTKMKTVNDNVPDCWIYIQDRSVKLGRLQIFNNWSPYMVDDMEKHVWVGLEYFCNEGDKMWTSPDKDFIDFAIGELESIGVIKRENVCDSFMARVKKAYPAYFGSYAEFDKVREYLDGFENLFCVGRNGQHRYNNMDHSMMTAIIAARNIILGSTDKTAVWEVNTEKEYHETNESNGTDNDGK